MDTAAAAAIPWSLVVAKCREKTCAGNVFSSPEVARKVVLRMRKKGHRVIWFRCRACALIHIGGSGTKIKRKERQRTPERFRAARLARLETARVFRLGERAEVRRIPIHDQRAPGGRSEVLRMVQESFSRHLGFRISFACRLPRMA